ESQRNRLGMKTCAGPCKSSRVWHDVFPSSQFEIAKPTPLVRNLMTDQERAQIIVRDVFVHDLKGEIGTLARLGVPLADRQDIISGWRRNSESCARKNDPKRRHRSR
ncbi:hypothetical protein, partial [Klebsiella pneumoniae]|uniref:hypothetical protein n=1 Tax=Klebsiella pneumoniae TaxID=573 RepID=UPI001C603D7E